MRLSALLIVAGVFTAAASLSVVAAQFSVRAIEVASKGAVLNALDRDGLTWAEVDTSGLQVFLIGTAPDEATRFEALTAAGRVVDAARVIDNMLVQEPDGIAPPRFSIEVLRNDSGISVIGLVPADTDRADLIARFDALAPDDQVSDLLEAASFPAPEGWDDALRYATWALERMPRAKISVEAGRVAVKAAAEDAEAARLLETELSRRAPEGVRLALDIDAPRPVIQPYSLRLRLEDGQLRLDACSADSEAARDRILRAAVAAGVEGKSSCALGLGAPTRRWAEAAEKGIAALAGLGGGTLEFTNADVALTAAEGTDQALFDRVAGELQATLPPVFALTATLPQPQEAADVPAEFSATLSPGGELQMRGRVPAGAARTTVESFARARFGSDNVYMAARSAENLPADWSVRVLAALEALASLDSGAVTLGETAITLKGRTGRQETRAEIAALLRAKLGDEAAIALDVTYDERLDATLGIPTPEECEGRIVEIIGDRKITFEPGSATLDASAKDILDEVSELLKLCGDIPLEIGGHTDSQGREAMNEELSRDRAQAVLDALQNRQVLVASYAVRGYGESRPIADNDTEEGREANRRIEFRLIRREDDGAGQQTAGDTAAAEGTGDGQN